MTKRRHLLLWKDVRIHLDEVDGQGSFVELEAVEMATAAARLTRLRTALHIADERLVSRGYLA